MTDNLIEDGFELLGRRAGREIDAGVGQVAVRPEVDLPVPGIDPAQACRWVGSAPGPDDLYDVPRAEIRRFPDRQVVVVRHVSCAPGQQLRILVTGATGFRDAVGITDTDDPCSTLDLERRTVAHRFTAADRGTVQIRLTVPTTFAYHNSVHLRSWDVSHGARAGISNAFTISAHVPPGVVVNDADPGFVCTSPVSYH